MGTKQSLVQHAARGRQSVAQTRKRFARELRWWLTHTAPPPVPGGPLLLLADAMWFTFARTPWTLYLLALRPVAQPVAYFQDPVLLPGREAARGWHQALATIPATTTARVRALVSDGFRGSHTWARHHGWIQQRCHFHLIAQLHGRRGRFTHLPSAPVREALYQTTRVALVTRDPERLAHAETTLRHLVAQPQCPDRLAMIGRDFLRQLPAFRAYLRCPELQLPTTTNVLESMARRVRDRVRPLNSPDALRRWATATIRLAPRMACKGADCTGAPHQPD